MSQSSLRVALAAAELMGRLGLSARQAEAANDAADVILGTARTWMTDAIARGMDPHEAANLMGCGLAVALKIDAELASERNATVAP